AVSLHSRGFSDHEVVIYCAIGLAVTPVVSFAFWFAERLMPSRDSLTWWQWFFGRNFLAEMIGYAILLGVGSVITLALGQYWVALGMGAGSLASAVWARSKHRRLSSSASER
ncbi:MAG: hypothetical protein QOH13_2332, partial [Thermoleophilaceae bacterium]|nr:hypothetical protein [Thermoleophilaceae bacterium]